MPKSKRPRPPSARQAIEAGRAVFAAAQEQAARDAAARILEAGQTAVDALLSVAQRGEGEFGTGRAGAARTLLEFAGLIGRQAAQRLEVGARQGDDGKLEIVVRYEQAKPPEADDAAG